MKTLADLPLDQQLGHCSIGTRIWFAEEKQPYRVRARSKRYLVCTKPFNPRRTTLYTIVDLDEQVRGPENLIFGMGAETDEHCVGMVERLHGISKPLTLKGVAETKAMPRRLRKMCQSTYEEPTEMSRRHQIALRVVRVVLA